jgi:uncharacterized protein
MKLSRYSFLFSHNADCYIYNSLSNALLKIDLTLYNELKSQSRAINESSLSPELLDILINNNFITNNDKDDFLIYKSIIATYRL